MLRAAIAGPVDVVMAQIPRRTRRDPFAAPPAHHQPSLHRHGKLTTQPLMLPAIATISRRQLNSRRRTNRRPRITPPATRLTTAITQPPTRPHWAATATTERTHRPDLQTLGERKLDCESVSCSRSQKLALPLAHAVICRSASGRRPQGRARAGDALRQVLHPRRSSAPGALQGFFWQGLSAIALPQSHVCLVGGDPAAGDRVVSSWLADPTVGRVG